MTIQEICDRLEMPYRKGSKAVVTNKCTETNTKKPIVVSVRCIDWIAPTSVARELQSHITFPLTIEYLTKHGVFEIRKRNSFEDTPAFNKERFEERIIHLLIGEFEHTMKSLRYKVTDWGDSPFTMPQDGETLVAIQ